jgi:hypothetical protein
MQRPTFNAPTITYRFFIKDNFVKFSFPVEAYESSENMLLCISNMGLEYDSYIDKDVEDGSQVFYEYSSETDSLYEVDYDAILAQVQSEASTSSEE